MNSTRFQPWFSYTPWWDGRKGPLLPRWSRGSEQGAFAFIEIGFGPVIVDNCFRSNPLDKGYFMAKSIDYPAIIRELAAVGANFSLHIYFDDPSKEEVPDKPVTYRDHLLAFVKDSGIKVGN